MREEGTGVVVAVAAAGASAGPAAAPGWLRDLAATLDDACGELLRSPFVQLDGGLLAAQLAAGADPIEAFLHGTLRQAERARSRAQLRWAIAAAGVETGQAAGGASAVATDTAITALADGQRERVGLVMRSGHPGADRLLVDIAPVIAEMLELLTPRQRDVARLMLVDGLRQAEAAERLGIARSTVGVIAARARIRSVERLVDAARTVFAAGLADAGATDVQVRDVPGPDSHGRDRGGGPSGRR